MESHTQTILEPTRAAGSGTTVASWLDAHQRTVVGLEAAASGVVLGSPGTGKTTALVERVRTLVAAGIGIDEIVVLTPSRSTAASLRDRLGLAVGGASDGALAHSVASFAFRIVRAAAVRAGDDEPRLLTGGDEDQIIQDLLDGDAQDEGFGAGRWPQWLTSEIRATRPFRAEVRAFLAECATLGMGPGRLAQIAHREGSAVWAALADFLGEYLQVRADMRTAHRDAAGLVREAAGLLAAADVASWGVTGAVRALLVDDAQELTGGGVDLLLACHSRGIPVLAFGDPDVGAGAFRGATVENFTRLTASLGAHHVLATPHRGTPVIVDLVRSVTGRIGAAGPVAHRRPAGDAAQDGSVRVLRVGSHAEELDAIARILRQRHLRDGIPWSDCAVIAHDTRQVAQLEAELTGREVPARAQGPNRALGELAAARALLGVVQLGAAGPDEWTVDGLSDALLNPIGGFDPVQLRRLRGMLRHEELRAGGQRSAAALLVSAFRHPLELELIDSREARRAARLARTLSAVRAGAARGDTAHELLWVVWEGSGLERGWAQTARGSGPLAEQAGGDLDAVVALFQAAKRYDERQEAADGNALQFVHAVLRSDVAQDRLEAAAARPAVAVLTPAGALGAQFDTVVVAGVQEGVWPNTRLRGSLLETWRLADADLRHRHDEVQPATVVDRRRTALHDELRLFVRAISRARQHLVITAVDDDDTGPSAFFELLPDASDPARSGEHPLTLRGLVSAHRRTLTDPAARTGERARADAAGQLALLADAGVAGADPAQWYGVAAPSSTAGLRDLSHEDVRVSPSRLQALETCALDWAISDLGGDPGGVTAGLGTIIHSALEHVADGTEEQLWDHVRSQWGQLEFDAPWLENQARAQARDLVRRLHTYLRSFADAGGRLVQAEPHFEVPISIDADFTPGALLGALPGALPGESRDESHGALLSGYIDRVEVTAEGTVVIVDLKTGKREPQTDAKVADNPQLAAYQLAFEAGAIEGAPGGKPGGAKLLVLRPTAKGKDYVEPHQAPLDDQARTVFVARVRAAVQTMRASAFTAPYEQHCRNEHTRALCRIHTIGAVSAS